MKADDLIAKMNRARTVSELGRAVTAEDMAGLSDADRQIVLDVGHSARMALGGQEFMERAFRTAARAVARAKSEKALTAAYERYAPTLTVAQRAQLDEIVHTTRRLLSAEDPATATPEPRKPKEYKGPPREDRFTAGAGQVKIFTPAEDEHEGGRE